MSCHRHSAPADHKSGILITTPYAGGPITQADTVRCCHCQYTSVWCVGSDKWWSLCTRCNGLCCGQRECLARGCVPWEQDLENTEHGRPANYRPIIVAVGG